MTLAPGLSQTVISVDIRLGRFRQGQCLRWIYLGMIGLFAIHQPVEQVQDMRLGWHASF
jgi:hypothetical protein